MIIIMFAYYVATFFVIFSFVKEHVLSGERLFDYFNINTETSNSFKLLMFSLYVSVGEFVLSFIIPPVALIRPFIHLVLYALAWYWLFDSYKAGYVTTWLADFKKFINK